MEDCGGGNTDCAVEGIITVYLSSSLSLSLTLAGYKPIEFGNIRNDLRDFSFSFS